MLEHFTESMLWPLLNLKPEEIITIDRVFDGLDMLKSNLALQCRDASIRFTCV